MIAELACYSYRMILVPLYETLGVDACAHIISEAEVSSCFCDKSEQALILLKLAAKTNVLRRIIIMDPPSEEVLTQSRKMEVEVITFEEMLHMGKENLVDLNVCKPIRE